MKFRTEVTPKENKGFIDHSHKILSVGSCFATHMTEQLHTRSFSAHAAPFGVVFNPVSIQKNVEDALADRHDGELVTERDGHFFHFDYHSQLGASTKEKLIENIKRAQTEFREKLRQTDRLIITLGTAWAYVLQEKNTVVANCHKVPQNKFDKKLLSLDELTETYTNFFKSLKEYSPQLQIIVTVSPVRHIKDGVRENNWSKSTLLLLTAELEKTFDFVQYFPAYELVLDDLRDYRFFEGDLVHPNAQAVAYIFQKFSNAYFTEDTVKISEFARKKSLLEAHVPRFESTDQKKRRAEQLLEIEQELNRLKGEL